MRAYSNARYGQGSALSPIWLDNVRCVGNETRLVDCPANEFGQEDCSHYEDAGVSCDTSQGTMVMWLNPNNIANAGLNQRLISVNYSVNPSLTFVTC